MLRPPLTSSKRLSYCRVLPSLRESLYRVAVLQVLFLQSIVKGYHWRPPHGVLDLEVCRPLLWD